MCGIVGLYNKKDKEIPLNTLEKMAAQIIHRGPDDFGFHVQNQVGLGFRRLSIIDLEGGHQPLCNEDESIWISFNGEIYNHHELKQSLIDKGHVFKTESDTEVIVHLYEEKGFDCVKDLRGMFCFALHDLNNDLVMIARDHFGIKPCYYTETSDYIAWGSEIKSLLQVPGVERKVNQTGFWHYLTFQYAPDPLTLFEGIFKLPAAHRMIIQKGKVRIERYWELQFEEEDKPLQYYIEGTKEILRDSVKAHMNSHVSRGAFLSSGVDSSTIVALLREMENVKTYTVGFEGAGGQSEIEYARETAKILGTEHKDLIVSSKEYGNILPRLIWQQDDPIADPAAIALYFVANLAAKDVTVVLSGEGADEVFGGYRIYREPLSLKPIQSLPSFVRKSLGELASMLPEGTKGRSYFIRGSKTLPERFVGNAFIFSEEEKKNFVSPLIEKSHYMNITRPYYQNAKQWPQMTQMQYVDFHTWLPGDILMKADKMTMTNSLELRVPFLDVKVFEWASKIPASYRFMNETTKYILREAVKDILPAEVKNRPKLGFPVPIRQWLRNEHYYWAKEILSEKGTEYLFNTEYALQLLEEHKTGKKDNARKIWTLLVFKIWHRIFIEERETFNPVTLPHVEKRKKMSQNIHN